MKLYGKKAIALFMAMAMTLSLCSMSAFAASKKEITKVDFDYEELFVPYGTDEDVVASLLPQKATVEFDEGDPEIWDIGRRNELEDWSVDFDDDEYTCTTKPDDDKDYKWDNDIEEKDCTLIVKAKDKYKGKDSVALTYTLFYNDNDDNELDLAELIADELEIHFEDFEISFDSSEVDVDDYDEDDLKYGEVEDLVYTVELDSDDYEKLIEDGKLDETVIKFEYDDGDLDIEGTLTITLINSVKDFKYTMGDKQAFNFGQWIVDKIDKVMTENLDYVEFTLDDRNDCGTLYADNKLTEFDEDAYYYHNSKDPDDFDIENLYFVSNGIEDDFKIEYYAYGEDDEELKGTIYIECSEFLFLDISIASNETYAFSAKEFEELVEYWDDDYSLVNLDNITLVTPNGGYLYYKYDEDDNKHDEISDTEEYYADKREKDIIDDITYVPGDKTEGIVIINFTASVRKGSSKKIDVPGTIQINVERKADITIEAGINALVKIDPELFQDYLEKVTKSTKYDVAYVTIYNAPRKAADGYLYTDNANLTARGDKTFYDKPSTKQYDLNDLYFQAGTEKGKSTATFKVFYYKTSSKAYSTSEGTIEFVVGESTSLSGELDAAQVMSFGIPDTLRAFVSLGGNQNLYVTFDKLPIGGKLVYDWGTASQQDVKAGAAYYIAGSSAVRQLSKITFVPSYSAVKTSAKTITIPVTAYNAKNKAVTGTINITVNYAAYSAHFTDITTSTYADSVDFLYNQKITTGMTTTTFGPNSNVTRAQFVTFLYRAAGQPAVTGVTNKFTDVKPTGTYAYAYNAILWAVQNNITTGRSETKFDPAANVTHQELLTFLYRYDVNYLKHPGTQGSLSGFSDASSLQSYAVAPAKWAAYKGIIDGYTLQPAVAGTRATVALWLHRMLTL